jgi:DnaK suppressor protein
MGAVSFGKRVGEGTSQAVERIAQVDAAQRLDAKLRDVERGLVKLDEGTYGICDVCGRPIGSERLEAIPWAILCLEHARSRTG